MRKQHQVTGEIADLAGCDIAPGMPLTTVDIGRGQDLVRIVVIEQGEADVLQVGAALCLASCLAGQLDRWQEQGDQDRDDRDHDEQLDHGEAGKGSGGAA